MTRFFIFIESGLGLTDRAKLLLLTHPHVTAQTEKEDIQEAAVFGGENVWWKMV